MILAVTTKDLRHQHRVIRDESLASMVGGQCRHGLRPRRWRSEGWKDGMIRDKVGRGAKTIFFARCGEASELHGVRLTRSVGSGAGPAR